MARVFFFFLSRDRRRGPQRGIRRGGPGGPGCGRRCLELSTSIALMDDVGWRFRRTPRDYREARFISRVTTGAAASPGRWRDSYSDRIASLHDPVRGRIRDAFKTARFEIHDRRSKKKKNTGFRAFHHTEFFSTPDSGRFFFCRAWRTRRQIGLRERCREKKSGGGPRCGFRKNILACGSANKGGRRCCRARAGFFIGRAGRRSSAPRSGRSRCRTAIYLGAMPMDDTVGPFCSLPKGNGFDFRFRGALSLRKYCQPSGIFPARPGRMDRVPANYC